MTDTEEAIEHMATDLMEHQQNLIKYQEKIGIGKNGRSNLKSIPVSKG